MNIHCSKIFCFQWQINQLTLISFSAFFSLKILSIWIISELFFFVCLVGNNHKLPSSKPRSYNFFFRNVNCSTIKFPLTSGAFMLLILTWYAFVCVLNRCEKKSNLLSQESLNGFQLIGYFNKTSTLKTNIYSNWEKEIETPIPFAKLTFRFRIGTLERTFRIAQNRKKFHLFTF